jgi:hypothetical protein
MSVHYNGIVEKLKHVAHFGQHATVYEKKVVIDSPSICLLVHHNRTSQCKTINSLYIEASRISDILLNTTQCRFCLVRVVTNGMNSLAHIKIKTKKLWIFTFKGLSYKH